MYVCLCNGFTDRQIRAEAAAGTCSVAMVYRSLGAEPQCGKCVPTVCQLVKQASQLAQSSLGALAVS